MKITPHLGRLENYLAGSKYVVNEHVSSGKPYYIILLFISFPRTPSPRGDVLLVLKIAYRIVPNLSGSYAIIKAFWHTDIAPHLNNYYDTNKHVIREEPK